jgi:hypothetical protein
MMEGGLRLAPRFFTRDTIAEIADKVEKQSFTFRFEHDSDRRLALRALDAFDENQPFTSWKQVPGSTAPRISFVFNVSGTLRSLMKIGVNLVAAYCKNTPVNPESFANVIQLIRGTIQITPMMFGNNGFVSGEAIACIARPGMNHTFRLVHLSGMWFMYACFFGGRLGAAVHFPGPNNESWQTADIVAPIRSKEWVFKTSSLVQLMNPKTDWNKSARLSPSLKMHSGNATFVAQLVRVRQPK